MMDSEEAGKYMKMVKVQQQRGLQKLKGDRESKDGVFSYKVDPYTLRSGDYVVHRKVGVGRFVGMRFDVAKRLCILVHSALIESSITCSWIGLLSKNVVANVMSSPMHIILILNSSLSSASCMVDC